MRLRGWGEKELCLYNSREVLDKITYLVLTDPVQPGPRQQAVCAQLSEKILRITEICRKVNMKQGTPRPSTAIMSDEPKTNRAVVTTWVRDQAGRVESHITEEGVKCAFPGPPLLTICPIFES